MTISLPSAPPVVSPRVRSVPEHSFSSGPEAVELAASAGLVLDPWQALAVDDVLAEDERGKWAAFESGLLIPRQNGKGAILECIELADLFLFSSGQPDFLVIHTAHEFKTAQEAFRRVLFLVENNDWLRKKVARVRTSHGEEGLELLTGQRLRFLARSGGSGRGFSADRLIYDEAYELSEESVAASLPTMSARKNPHVTYTSSAALDKSRVLRSVMARGRLEDEREPDPGLCYIEFSADPRADLDDHEQWRLANPAMGYRIREEFVAKERAAMSDVTFGRERLGIVDESKTSTVIDMQMWATAEDNESPFPRDPICFAIDIGPDGTHTSIAVAGAHPDGRIQTEVVDRRKGRGWVVDRIEELREKWHPASIVFDPKGPVGSLKSEFDVAGIPYVQISYEEHAQACGLFKSLVENVEEGVNKPKVVHPFQPGLTAALEAARKRPAGDAGAWLWNRRDDTDISQLVAVTLAVFAYSRTKPPEPETNQVIVFR